MAYSKGPLVLGFLPPVEQFCSRNSRTASPQAVFLPNPDPTRIFPLDTEERLW